MSLLKTIRRFHLPLTGLAVGCVLSMGCQSRSEMVYLGRPELAYQAPDGSVMFGYFVERTKQPDYTGWHWLIIEPNLAERLLLPVEPINGSYADRKPILAVDYRPGAHNARLIPPLLDPGFAYSDPPTEGIGELSELQFEWEPRIGGIRLLDETGQTLPLVLVSPGYEVYRDWGGRDMEGLLAVIGVGLMLVGVVALKLALSELDDDDDDCD